MKLLFITFIATAIGALAIPAGPPQHICTLQCRLEKPVCPKGEAPTGSEGCWGCCQPIPVPTVAERAPEDTDAFCTTVCRTVKPVCPVGQAASGSPGCWGCCQPVKPRVCLAVCLPEKPVCPDGEAATGNEECWGCCQPIGSF